MMKPTGYEQKITYDLRYVHHLSYVFTKYAMDQDSLCWHSLHQQVDINSICFVHLRQITPVNASI